MVRVRKLTGLDVWNPDYNEFPKFAEANCANVIVEEVRHRSGADAA
eukprot:SAG11_NODE_2285_length_3571_cov_2.005184_3_plen_46_part_00